MSCLPAPPPLCFLSLRFLVSFRLHFRRPFHAVRDIILSPLLAFLRCLLIRPFFVPVFPPPPHSPSGSAATALLPCTPRASLPPRVSAFSPSSTSSLCRLASSCLFTASQLSSALPWSTRPFLLGLGCPSFFHFCLHPASSPSCRSSRCLRLLRRPPCPHPRLFGHSALFCSLLYSHVSLFVRSSAISPFSLHLRRVVPPSPWRQAPLCPAKTPPGPWSLPWTPPACPRSVPPCSRPSCRALTWHRCDGPCSGALPPATCQGSTRTHS